MSRGFAFGVAILASLLAGAASAQPANDDAELEQILSTLQPQRPGVVDAYVIAVAFDTDPVFNREAREAGRVLAQRFDAQGRTIVLAAGEPTDRARSFGSPPHLAQALNRAARLMDLKEDVLILYSTSHGSPRAGINYRDAVHGGSAIITPAQFAALLDEGRFANRLLILQACFSGQFVPALSGPRTVIATAASATRSSFGCSAGNDWTFFGHALVNQAMRQPDTFQRQFRRAFVTIYGWEKKLGIDPSDPQISIGKDTGGWLAALDARAPKVASIPVGQPPSELTLQP